MRGAGSSVLSGGGVVAQAEEAVRGGCWLRWEPEEGQYPPGLQSPCGSQGRGNYKVGSRVCCVDWGPAEGFSITGV